MSLKVGVMPGEEFSRICATGERQKLWEEFLLQTMKGLIE